MIFLGRPTAPQELDSATISQLTAEYAATKNTVWKKKFIIDALSKMSHEKCAYCEVSFAHRSIYMEVEHFKHKHQYPTLVVEWNNLLPSCKTCNTTKGTHDVGAEPIVDPSVQNPNNHLILKNYRFYPRDQLGKTTIDVLNLNEYTVTTKGRFEVGEALICQIDELEDLINTYPHPRTVRMQNKVRTKLEAILIACLPTKQYSRVCAQILHDDGRLVHLRTTLLSDGAWTTVHDSLLAQSASLLR